MRHCLFLQKNTLKLKKRHHSLSHIVHSNALVEYFLNFEKVGFASNAVPRFLWSQTIAVSLQLVENLVENSC